MVEFLLVLLVLTWGAFGKKLLFKIDVLNIEENNTLESISIIPQWPRSRM